jgi:N-acetylneuraminate synthase
MENLRIGDKLVGDGEPCFIIAEAGVNHNGNFELAKKLIDIAKQAGADAVKFQTFKSEGVTTATTNMASYQERNIGESESQVKMLRRLELEYGLFEELKKYCDEKGIIFLSTPHSYDAINFLDPLVPAHKVGSGDLTNIPSLEMVAKKGKPVILSTGMGTLEEIREAVDTIRNMSNEQIILLQCVTDYPSNLEDQNIRTVETLKNEFKVLTGFSDHTMGIIAPLVAVSLGACVIEKHFTLDRDLPGPDHKASLDPDELKEMIDSVRKAERALGTGIKKPTKIEIEIKRLARKSLVASIDITEGTSITRNMIDIKRPETGMRPKRLKEVIGAKAKRNISKDEVITEEMISW